MADLVPTFNRINVLVGLAAMFLQPWDPDVPAEMPADTLALGSVWPSPWTAPGATMSGLSFEVKRDSQSINIEEQMTAVDVRTKDMSFDANFELAEDTLKSMQLAYGGGIIEVTAPTADTPGISTLTISDEMDSFAFGFEGKNEAGFWRRVMFQPAKSIGQAKTAYRRSDSQRSYVVDIQALCAPSDVVIRNMDAAATG